jgi:hypothetical protein
VTIDTDEMVTEARVVGELLEVVLPSEAAGSQDRRSHERHMFLVARVCCRSLAVSRSGVI